MSTFRSGDFTCVLTIRRLYGAPTRGAPFCMSNDVSTTLVSLCHILVQTQILPLEEELEWNAGG